MSNENMSWTTTLDPDDYRGEVCTLLRTVYDEPELVDHVGGWSDELIAGNFQGESPHEAARMIIAGEVDEIVP